MHYILQPVLPIRLIIQGKFMNCWWLILKFIKSLINRIIQMSRIIINILHTSKAYNTSTLIFFSSKQKNLQITTQLYILQQNFLNLPEFVLDYDPLLTFCWITMCLSGKKKKLKRNLHFHDPSIVISPVFISCHSQIH